MPRKIEPGVPAQYKYQDVLFLHVETDPGASLLLTADPWSFLTAHLSKLLPNSRGDRRASLERAVYYADLAEGFYLAAENTVLPTRAALAYYGMLNLVKCYLAINRAPLEVQQEHHGLTLPMKSNTTVGVAKLTKDSVNIFHKFAELLGTPVEGAGKYEIQEIASHIPEVHEIAFSLDHVRGSKRFFLPIEIKFLVNADRNRLFTEMQYDKKHEARVRYQNLYKGERAEYFRDLGERDGSHVYRSWGRKYVTNENWPRVYRNVIREYSRFDMASLLTPDGYRYYCDLGNPKFHHLAYSLMLTFYAGTIARYRPRAMEKIMGGDLRPVISEAIAITPRQFLYQLVSMITEQVCAVPHASLIGLR